MSEDKPVTEAFDLWLADGLKKSLSVSPAFAQNVVRQMQRLQAERLLRKVVWQQRIAGLAAVLVVVCGLGAAFCLPLSRMAYAAMRAMLTALVQTIMDPTRVDLPLTLVVLFGLGWLVMTAWQRLTSEF